MKPGAAVMLGGAAGTLARAGLAEAWPITPGALPWATLVANVAGSLLRGWLVTTVAAGRWRPLVGTGFCGALTTFSGFQLQLVELADSGHAALAAVYLAVSIAAGLAAAALGRWLAR
jgi:CrcB protein